MRSSGIETIQEESAFTQKQVEMVYALKGLHKINPRERKITRSRSAFISPLRYGLKFAQKFSNLCQKSLQLTSN